MRNAPLAEVCYPEVLSCLNLDLAQEASHLREGVMATQAIFQTQWQTCRKVIERNYMFHREVYGLLHKILITEAPKPFRFLDIACGDGMAARQP